MNESSIPETVKIPVCNKHQVWFGQDSQKWNDICHHSSQIMQEWKVIVEDPYLPPTMAQTLVRKCKNETFSSVKVTCKMLFQYYMRPKKKEKGEKKLVERKQWRKIPAAIID